MAVKENQPESTAVESRGRDFRFRLGKVITIIALLAFVVFGLLLVGTLTMSGGTADTTTGRIADTLFWFPGTSLAVAVIGMGLVGMNMPKKDMNQ